MILLSNARTILGALGVNVPLGIFLALVIVPAALAFATTREKKRRSRRLNRGDGNCPSRLRICSSEGKSDPWKRRRGRRCGDCESSASLPRPPVHQSERAAARRVSPQPVGLATSIGLAFAQ